MYCCTEADRPRILDYIAAEPEMNLFLFGDLENYDLTGDPVSVYAFPDKEGPWSAVMLKYYDCYTLYSADPAFDTAPVAAFFADREYESMSGKADVLRRLAAYYPDKTLRITYLSRCAEVNESAVKPLPAGAQLMRILPEGVPEATRMLATIEEFRDSYADEDEVEDQIARTQSELRHGSVMYGVYEDDALVSVAATSAANSISAMVVAVATLPAHRGRGYAANAVAAVCRASFAEGRRFLCLFYDNPDAGRIYRSLGFTEIGEYAMLR